MNYAQDTMGVGQLGQARYSADAVAFAQGLRGTVMNESAEKEIPSLITRLAASLKEAHDVADRFNSRLSRVMRSEPPSDTAGRSPQPVPNCEMGGALSNLNDELSSLIHRMRYMLDRLEV